MFSDYSVSNCPSPATLQNSSQLSEIILPELSPIITQKVAKKLEPLSPIKLACSTDSAKVSAGSQTMTGRFSGDQNGFQEMVKLNTVLDSMQRKSPFMTQRSSIIDRES